MKKMALTILLMIILLYALLAGWAYLMQGKMLYFPLREITATPRDIGLDFEKVTLMTGDNVRISAWYIPARHQRGVVLFCHGNAGNISHRLDSIRIFHDLNLGVFIFDYRGYGESEGSPGEQGTYADAEAAWRYLVGDRAIAQEKIILFGRSLGGAVAAEAALRHAARALIIESSFTSVPELGSDLYPWLPVRLLSRYHYRTGEKVRVIGIPKLFIHSPDDEIIPFEHGKRLFEQAGEPKDFFMIRGGHNEGFLISEEGYRRGLDAFLSKYL